MRAGLVLLFAWILPAALFLLPHTLAQEDQESPPESTAEIIEADEITESAPSPSEPVIQATETPLPTAPASPPPSPTPELTAEMTAASEAAATDMATEPPPAPTAESTVEPTAEPTVESTVEPTADSTAENTAEVQLTAAVESTAESATLTATPTATLTPVLAMIAMQGSAHYQHHQPDESGITIVVADGSGAILYTTTTTPEGSYQIGAPAEAFFWLRISAPLHRPFEIGVWPGEALPDVTLAGGDLDGDGCIGALDLRLLAESFESTGSPGSDITGDGSTNAVDLAILAANYDLTCVAAITPTPAPGATLSPTEDVTDEAEALTPEVSVTEMMTPDQPEVTAVIVPDEQGESTP